MTSARAAAAAAAAGGEEVASAGSDPPAGDDCTIAFCIIISPCTSLATAGPDGPAGNARRAGDCGIGDVALEVVEGRANTLFGVLSSISSNIASAFLLAPGPNSMPKRRAASSKGFVRGGRVATTEDDRAIGGLDQALRTELAGEAGAEATRHCVT